MATIKSFTEKTFPNYKCLYDWITNIEDTEKLKAEMQAKYAPNGEKTSGRVDLSSMSFVVDVKLEA